MRILITGGAGFIGSHLADLLIPRHTVLALDNLITGSTRNIAHLREHPAFTFIAPMSRELSALKASSMRFSTSLHCPARLITLKCPSRR